MSKAKEQTVTPKPRGKAVHRKSSVNAPTIGISPTTKKLMEENKRIISAYSKKSQNR